MLKVSRLWPLRAPAAGLCILSTGPRHPESILACWHKVYQAYLVHIRTQPRSQSFLQGALVPLGGK